MPHHLWQLGFFLAEDHAKIASSVQHSNNFYFIRG